MFKLSITYIYHKVKGPFKKLKWWLKQKSGKLGNPIIIPYRGYGCHDYYYISGRVTEDNGLAEPKESHNMWQNMLAMLKRFSGDLIPGVKIKSRFYGQEQTVITDEEGFFEVFFGPVENIDFSLQWHRVDMELVDRLSENQQDIRATGEIQVCAFSAKYGVISDIDDTILISHSTNFFKKIRLLLMKNAVTRLPFEGASGFYRALSAGSDMNSTNPIFFISSSEWNLYDLLIDFFNFRRIPKATLLLDDLRKGVLSKKKSRGHLHKSDKIRVIMQAFSSLSFILIGDSGQKDAEIYSSIASEFPGQVLCIYIRDVKKSRKNEVTGIALENQKKGIRMMLVKNTAEAAIHAVNNGYISSGSLNDIFREINMDELAPSEFEDIFP